MAFAVEVWTVSLPDDEEPQRTEQVECREFQTSLEAHSFAWERLEEGYFVRLWRRQ
jgi:hypothetical protein